MNISELINFGSNLLKENKINSHILDAEILLSKTLKKSREEILVNFDQTIEEKYMVNYKSLLERRIKKEPIAYIIEEKEFWSTKFYVNNNTLIPRPETELLVDTLLKTFNRKKISILDIGTGSGCIILSLLNNLKHASGLGIDVSKSAILIAKKNGNKFNLQNRLKFMNMSFERLFNKKFDLIVSNPPYIEKKRH